MRNIFLCSLALTIVAGAGCGSQPKEQAAGSELKRDLTLASRVSDTTVTSALELGEIRTQPRNTVASQRTVRPRRVVRQRPARQATAEVAKPVIADVVVSSPAAQATAVTAIPADSRELPPGKTVTVIPVSSGPSPGPAGRNRFPEDIPAYGETGDGGIGGIGGGGSGMGGGGSGMGGGGSGMGGGCPGRAPGVGIASRPMY
jgi:uncharacterized membrane protein YgcG